MTLATALTLFFTAFGAATILPGLSEVVFTTQLLDKPQAWPTLLLIATAGNTLGGVANWLLTFGSKNQRNGGCAETGLNCLSLAISDMPPPFAE